jgi:hypothetical protein
MRARVLFPVRLAARQSRAQRDYTSLNYTHVARAVAPRGINVVLQLVGAARRPLQPVVESRTPVLDLLGRDRAHRQAAPVRGRAWCTRSCRTSATRPRCHWTCSTWCSRSPGPAHRLFGHPRESVTASEFALGLHAAEPGAGRRLAADRHRRAVERLVYALILRHRDNDAYRAALAAVRNGASTELCREIGGEAPFARGLYGASEMVMDGFMHLRDAGILTRRVFDDIGPSDRAERGPARRDAGRGTRSTGCSSAAWSGRARTAHARVDDALRHAARGHVDRRRRRALRGRRAHGADLLDIAIDVPSPTASRDDACAAASSCTAASTSARPRCTTGCARSRARTTTASA